MGGRARPSTRQELQVGGRGASRPGVIPAAGAVLVRGENIQLGTAPASYCESRKTVNSKSGNELQGLGCRRPGPSIPFLSGLRRVLAGREAIAPTNCKLVSTESCVASLLCAMPFSSPATFPSRPQIYLIQVLPLAMVLQWAVG